MVNFYKAAFVLLSLTSYATARAVDSSANALAARNLDSNANAVAIDARSVLLDAREADGNIPGTDMDADDSNDLSARAPAPLWRINAYVAGPRSVDFINEYNKLQNLNHGYKAISVAATSANQDKIVVQCYAELNGKGMHTSINIPKGSTSSYSVPGGFQSWEVQKNPY